MAGNLMIVLENGLERKKMFHVMVSKDRFYEVSKCSCPTEVTLMIRLEKGLEKRK